MLTKLAAISVAPQPEREPTLSERATLAQPYLDKRLDVWKKRLHLQKWNVTVQTAKPSALRAGTVGNIHWDIPTRTATIRVLDAADYKTPFRVALRDMETTLVHELIHLQLAALPRNDASRSEEELAVNNMAAALLEMDDFNARR